MIGPWESLADTLEASIRGHVRREEPLSAHTTFGIGGPVDILVEPASEADLAQTVSLVRQAGAPWFTMGSGSNLLVCDEGIEGAVIRILENLAGVERVGDTLRAEAGLVMDRLCDRALEEGLSGLEQFAGIPGTVGGAVYMNAGAFGQEVLEVVGQVRVLDEQDRWVSLAGSEIQRGYRRTALMDSGMIVTGADFLLRPGRKEAIAAHMQEVRARRCARIPHGVRCAGSVFKNPKPEAAGRLLDQAGCKGLCAGGAVVSELHANVIVNQGGASAADVLTLMREMRQRVRDRFGVELEPEIVLKGVSL